ncbi:hypothetical protein GNF72_06785 [Clostridium perfringens]|uniref:SIR2 family protein n=1 Tax=Clostridium perfringens TaxID=1502 RepID=UPI002AC68BFA|nr:SIR2 family protein [Clostridium perfringens]MDZ5014968.1 hypothetical protein [Clostridium perfringens]
MNLKEALHYALDGQALLFAGAGFSIGAKNISGNKFLDAQGFSKLLVQKGNLDIDEEDKTELEYVSNKFLKQEGAEKLKELLKNNYITYQVSDTNKEICKIDWKRIYTTNYDDVIECASKEVNIHREAVFNNNKMKDYVNKKRLVIHINGFVKAINKDSFRNDIILTEDSYINSFGEKSRWDEILSNDIENSKCIFFVGYSLQYDPKIRKILNSSDDLKKKCFFITFNPKKRVRETMEEYGEVYEWGTDGFVKELNIAKKEHLTIPKSESLECFDEICDEDFKYEKVSSRDMIDLLYKGKINENILMKNNKAKYILKREKVENIVNQFDQGYELALIISDLGNGKTIMIESLKKELAKNYKVFYFKNYNKFFLDDIEKISMKKGKKVLILENYTVYLNKKILRDIDNYRDKDLKIVLTARSYINDNFYGAILKDMEINPKKITICDINKLSDKDIRSLVEILEYNKMWGEYSKDSKTKKFKFIKQKCKGEIKNLLLKLYESPVISNKICKIMDNINRDGTLKDLTLLILINNVIKLDLKFNTLLKILNISGLSGHVSKNKDINELLNFKSSKIIVKSPIVAQYILQKGEYGEEVISLIIRIMENINELYYIPEYERIMKLLISFSNLRLILNKDEKKYKNNINTFYENIKNLKYNIGNPFFCLQYAIANMEIKNYEMAELLLKAAYSHASDRENFDTYQIDTHKARFILESTLHYGRARENLSLYETFAEAHKLIYYNSNKEAKLHFPLRQVGNYYNYYRKFYSKFNDDEKYEFLKSCYEIKEKIEEYYNAIQKEERQKNYEIKVIDQKIQKIINDIAKTKNSDNNINYNVVNN